MQPERLSLRLHNLQKRRHLSRLGKHFFLPLSPTMGRHRLSNSQNASLQVYINKYSNKIISKFHILKLKNLNFSLNPCVNGATCVNTGDYYTCICKEGFEGSHCESDINECISQVFPFKFYQFLDHINDIQFFFNSLVTMVGHVSME